MQGIITSMVTGFTEKGEVDYKSLINNLSFQKNAGINSVCVLGGTGEASALSQEERHEVMETTMNNSQGLKVVFGALVGKPSEIIKDIESAKKLQAYACMVMPPLFIKPSEKDIELYIKKLNKIGMPLILFNTPSRTGVTMSCSLISKLAKLENVIGIKESSGNLSLFQDIYQKTKKENFKMLTGTDELYTSSMLLGSKGGLLASAAVFPEILLSIEKHILSGDLNTAKEIHYTLRRFTKLMYKESHPVPLKVAMNFRGLQVGMCREPFTNIDNEYKNNIYSTIENIMNELQSKVDFASIE